MRMRFDAITEDGRVFDTYYVDYPLDGSLMIRRGLDCIARARREIGQWVRFKCSKEDD